MLAVRVFPVHGVGAHIRRCESVCSSFVWFGGHGVGAYVCCYESVCSSFAWFEVHGVGVDDFRGTWFSVCVVCGVVLMRPYVRLECSCLVVFVIKDTHLPPFLYCTTLIFLA